MASLQAHVLDALMRVQFKRRLRGVTSLETAREVLQSGSLPVPAQLKFTPATIGGVAGEWVHDPRVPAQATLLYLHGGGYFACSPKTHRPITGAYASQGFAVFVPDYRLAPEHPFPAAIEDAERVWNGLITAGHAAETVGLSGDSAGGGLALALMLSLKAKGQGLPAAAALLSPWTDLEISGASVQGNARREAMFWAPGLRSAAAAYYGAASSRDPLVSAIHADLAGLSPILIHVGAREMLLDDSTRLAERLTAAGSPPMMEIWSVVPHVWQLAQFVPEAQLSIQKASNFLRDRCRSANL